MGLKFDKVKKEWSEFKHEIVVENKPRYKNPKEWPHLYIDFFVALFDMSYTLGHLAGFGLIIGVIVALI